jgi:hypothetical protein
MSMQGTWRGAETPDTGVRDENRTEIQSDGAIAGHVACHHDHEACLHALP